MEYYSPLRYPGGKAKISGFIKQVYQENLLSDGVYVEPYAGGASVAISLLVEEYARKIIINDLDRSIYSFWYAVLNETDKLCKKIRDTNVDVDVWIKQKKVQQAKERAGVIELAFSTFFLNRTNRSGIIRAGVIGGKEQKGNFKIDARYNKKDLIDRIVRVAEFRDRIELYNMDAVKLIGTIKSKLPSRTLVYLDPPYYVKGKELYVNHYKHEDHVLVSKAVQKLSSLKWMVSYDNTPQIKEIYSGHKSFEYSLSYSAVNAKEGSEVMFYHNELSMPEGIIPSKI